MKTWRALVALLLLSAVPGPSGYPKQKDVAARQAAQNTAECCAPPVALSEVESKVGELATVAGECPTADELGLAQAKKDFAELFSKDSAKTEADVYGINLAGTAEQLEFAKKIVGGEGISNGDRLPSAWPSSVKDCTEVVCALAKLFGSEEPALRALNVAKRTGYFISASQFLNPAGVEQIWRASEIRTIDEATQKAPENFRRLPTMKYFYRIHDSYQCAQNPNRAAQAVSGWGGGGGRIEVYAGTFSDEGFAAPTILHELAHHLDYSGFEGDNLAQSTGFVKLSGWDSGNTVQTGTDLGGNPKYEKVYTPARADNFITDYARTTPSEDWADTAAYYVYAPEILKKIAPEKYGLMKEKVFGGKEYQEESWPALEQAVKSAGGGPILFQQCLDRILDITPDFGKDTGWVKEVHREEIGYVSWRSRPPEQFPFRTRCLKKKAEEIAEALKADPSFCGRGGVSAVEDALRKKIMWPLRSMFGATLSAAKEPAKTAAKRCFEKKDFTRACATGSDAIKAALLANAEFSALPEATRKEVEAHILNLVASPELAEAVVKEFTPGRTLQACLMGANGLSVREEGVLYLTNVTEASGGLVTKWVNTATEPSVAKSCLRSLEKEWRANGFIVDESAERVAADVFKSQQMSEIVDSFQNDVLLKWAASLKSCDDDAARPSCMEGVIKAWAEKHKLGSEFDSASLANRLLETVKVE